MAGSHVPTVTERSPFLDPSELFSVDVGMHPPRHTSPLLQLSMRTASRGPRLGFPRRTPRWRSARSTVVRVLGWGSVTLRTRTSRPRGRDSEAFCPQRRRLGTRVLGPRAPLRTTTPTLGRCSTECELGRAAVPPRCARPVQSGRRIVTRVENGRVPQAPPALCSPARVGSYRKLGECGCALVAHLAHPRGAEAPALDLPPLCHPSDSSCQSVADGASSIPCAPARNDLEHRHLRVRRSQPSMQGRAISGGPSTCDRGRSGAVAISSMRSCGHPMAVVPSCSVLPCEECRPHQTRCSSERSEASPCQN